MPSIEILFRDEESEKQSPKHYLLEMPAPDIAVDTRAWLRIGTKYFCVVNVYSEGDEP